jgi:zinc ribbon protein
LLYPGEEVIMSGEGSVEQVFVGKGGLHLTAKRLFLAHRSGLVRKRETPLLDVEIGQISYAKTEGTVKKVLVVGVRGAAGQVLAYKIKVSGPNAWVEQILRLKGVGGGAAPQSPPSFGPIGQTSSDPGSCRHCGEKLAPGSAFCPACGKAQ